MRGRVHSKSAKIELMSDACRSLENAVAPCVQEKSSDALRGLGSMKMSGFLSAHCAALFALALSDVRSFAARRCETQHCDRRRGAVEGAGDSERECAIRSTAARSRVRLGPAVLASQRIVIRATARSPFGSRFLERRSRPPSTISSWLSRRRRPSNIANGSACGRYAQRHIGSGELALTTVDNGR